MPGKMKILPGQRTAQRNREVSYVGGNSKSPVLFISQPELLKACYRRAKKLTLIVDVFIFHKSREI